MLLMDSMRSPCAVAGNGDGASALCITTEGFGRWLSAAAAAAPFGFVELLLVVGDDDDDDIDGLILQRISMIEI